MLPGLLVIGLFSLLGEALERFLHVPLPGSVLGLVLLVLALQTGLVRRAWVERAAGALGDRMALFLVPAAVAVFAEAGAFSASLVPIVVASVLSAVLVFAVVGRVAQALGPRL